MKSFSIFQTPEPGKHIVQFRGDIITFELSLSSRHDGNAWLRTNIGHAAISRQEIIRYIEQDAPPLGRGWFDIPMTRIDGRHFRLSLPLTEVGHFEAKCLFIPAGPAGDPLWSEGPNTTINVEPEDTCCANIIYNAFVRQFGPNKAGGAFQNTPSDWIDDLDARGYTVIPPSGTFRDLIKELDFIIGELGCRIVQLLPIHPTPTTFGRMGRYGSPYAALSFTTVDPALAEFDPKATPLEQFIELVDAVHQRNGQIIIDIAVNHTGWGADLHEAHPQWLARDTEGNIEVPGAWGVLWEDLTKLDYRHKDLWQYVADVFLTWCRRGVDGFRCDAGYMIPVAAWKYIIARVREQFPATVFFLEGLGGKIAVTRDLLNTANFNWAYSELFQNYDRIQIEKYLQETREISQGDGSLIHFAETHDNQRLAAKSTLYAKMRTALCALLSCRGGFGFANGVEWYATQKIVVHEAPDLNWGASENQVEQIRKLNYLLREHPVFHDLTEMRQIPSGEGNCIVLMRHHLPTGAKLLVLVNLDDENQTLGIWETVQGLEGQNMFDILTESSVAIQESRGNQSCMLAPGQVLCLIHDGDGFKRGYLDNISFIALPERIQRQRFKAKYLDVITSFSGLRDLGKLDVEKEAKTLVQDPISVCRNLNPGSEEPMVVTWRWPRDLKREVMVPPGHFLLILADTSFSAVLEKDERVVRKENALKQDNGTFFALVTPLPAPEHPASYILKLTFFASEGRRHRETRLLYLPRPQESSINKRLSGTAIRQDERTFLSTNARGGMLRTCVSWGELHSRYDCLLAANLNGQCPEDRWIMLTRCRIWLVYQGYSHAIDHRCLDAFSYGEKGMGIWQCTVPVGQGENIRLIIAAGMTRGKNRTVLSFFRPPKADQTDRLVDTQPVRLILRPDIEDRSFHETTKAFTGPEDLFPGAVDVRSDGFLFSPASDRVLDIRMPSASFVWEPEWTYMVYRSLDAERGLDPHSDLFSPGYFSMLIGGGESCELTAGIHNGSGRDPQKRKPKARPGDFMFPDTGTPSGLVQILAQNLDHFVVNRGELTTVIAGYPWFLDWGRDALIFVRGLIAAGNFAAAKAVLKQFGMFESSGTLPNMIKGSDVGNRDTTDAPLWFCLACADLVRTQGNMDFLSESWEGRSIRQILLSIGNAFSTETPNGIRMDPESGLIFSPGHFTWMDTNHPAGTPREGYPIEIQALWYAALRFMAQIDVTENATHWERLAGNVQHSILEYFYREDIGYLSDCLHVVPGGSAGTAQADDALRPNQLLAVTLNAVSDKEICRKIVAACEELLVPGAIRSLADRPVARPLEIYHQNSLLNDPQHPYQGKYIGDEDTQRKPAYHNGTAWTWLFPSFCEAWVTAYGEKAEETALSLLCSSATLVNQGCVGHLPEILDGDFPHRQRGCDAQAWGISEWVRVWKIFGD